MAKWDKESFSLPKIRIKKMKGLKGMSNFTLRCNRNSKWWIMKHLWFSEIRKDQDILIKYSHIIKKNCIGNHCKCMVLGLSKVSFKIRWAWARHVRLFYALLTWRVNRQIPTSSPLHVSWPVPKFCSIFMFKNEIEMCS